MYCVKNFKTKKAVKEALAEAIARGEKGLEVYQPNGGLFSTPTPTDGRVSLEGPHYPAPHSWYASGVLEDGLLVKVS